MKYDSQQFERDRLRSDGSGAEPLATSERSLLDTNLSTFRLENMELRRKIDLLESEKTDLQQKHLKEVYII